MEEKAVLLGLVV